MQTWQPRVISSLLSCNAVDAFNAFRFETGKQETLTQFAHKLCKEMLMNKWDGHERKGKANHHDIAVSEASESEDSACEEDRDDDEDEAGASASQEAGRTLGGMLYRACRDPKPCSQENVLSQDVEEEEKELACRHRIRALGTCSLYEGKRFAKLHCRLCHSADARLYCLDCSGTNGEEVKHPTEVYALCNFGKIRKDGTCRECVARHCVGSD